MIKHIQNAVEYKEVLKEDKLIIDFFATWCGPCKMLAPVLEQISNERPDVTIAKVDIDIEDLREIAKNNSIQSVPTVLFYKKGKEVEKIIGFIQKDKIIEIINDKIGA